MGWLEAIEWVLLAFVLVLGLPPVGLFLRRRWLSSKTSVFDCAVRSPSPKAGFRLGLARYQDDTLEWYRVFAISLRPHLVLRQGSARGMGNRPPTTVESVVLFSDQRILRIMQDGKQWELALTPASATGLMSWLESAPPGAVGYPGGE